MRIQLIAELLLLLVTANGAPLIVGLLLGTRLDRPLDGNLRFLDGRPLLGPSKTIRGLISAVMATALLAPLLGLPPARGAAFGAPARPAARDADTAGNPLPATGRNGQ